jgi:hypothetical protein
MSDHGGNTLRVTPQASYSPEYTTPTQKISLEHKLVNNKINLYPNYFVSYLVTLLIC